MKVIVDTCIWSLALRRNNVKTNPYIEELKNLIEEIRVQFIGPVRQELLSGIKSRTHFDILKQHLRSFKDIDSTFRVNLTHRKCVIIFSCLPY